MLKRIITAVVAIAVLLPVLYFSETIVFPIVITLCALVATFEMLRCTGLLKKRAISVPLFLPAFLPMLPYFAERMGEWTLESVALLTAMVLALYLFAVLTFSHGKLSLADVSIAFLTEFYIVAAFGALVALRYRFENGQYIYLICFIGAWVTDTFAYFCGRFFGKHKLIPDVSPKKTVEGSIGGTVFCILSMFVYGWIIRSVTGGTVEGKLWVLAICGVAVALISQVGDLLMSVVKRTYGIKDYGKLFPGHGGVLDRFDSVMAVAITLLVICSVVNPFAVV